MLHSQAVKPSDCDHTCNHALRSRSRDKLLTAFHCVRAASSSEEILISRESLEGLPAASAAVGGMRRFFDISVPRNIGSDVNQLEGEAHVYNVDDLKEVRA